MATKRSKDNPSNYTLAKQLARHIADGDYKIAERLAKDLQYKLQPRERYLDLGLEERKRALLSIQSRPVERDFAIKSVRHLLDVFLDGLQQHGLSTEASIVYGIRNSLLSSSPTVADLRYMEAQIEEYRNRAGK